MSKVSKILFCGGGTGGHIYPALAVADYLKAKKQDIEMVFVGTKQGLEAKIVPQHGYKIEFIEVKGLKRKLTADNINTFIKFFKGYEMAKRLIKSFDPDVVVVTGGYVSLPVALAAKRFRKKIIMHEQNAYPGLANRIISRFCDMILISFEESKKFFANPNRTILTGNPIRMEILKYNKEAAKSSIGVENKFVVLAIGGSRGAENLNRAIIKLSKDFSEHKDVHFILSTGDEKYLEAVNFANQVGIKSNISIVPYISDMPRYLAASDVVVSRAGAIALAEITALGKPSIIVPSPYVANNHQEYNARALEKNGAAFVVREDELEGDKIKEYLKKLMNDKDFYEMMSKNSKMMGKIYATEEMAQIILKII